MHKTHHKEYLIDGEPGQATQAWRVLRPIYEQMIIDRGVRPDVSEQEYAAQIQFLLVGTGLINSPRLQSQFCSIRPSQGAGWTIDYAFVFNRVHELVDQAHLEIASNGTIKLERRFLKGYPPSRLATGTGEERPFETHRFSGEKLDGDRDLVETTIQLLQDRLVCQVATENFRPVDWLGQLEVQEGTKYFVQACRQYPEAMHNAFLSIGNSMQEAQQVMESTQAKPKRLSLLSFLPFADKLIKPNTLEGGFELQKRPSRQDVVLYFP